MANDIIVPIDLTDHIALRGYLQNLSVQVGTLRTNTSLGTSDFDSISMNPDSLLTAAQLDELVKSRVSSFEKDFYSTIDKVKYDLSLLIPDYTDIVKSIENTISVGDSTLGATITNNTLVAIDDEGTYALASDVTTLSTNLANNYSTTSVINQTYATQDAVGAIYEVAVEANGRVSGYRAVADGVSSVFEIYAEKFAISSSATQEGYQPFQVDTLNHKINMTADVAIDGNLIVSKSITANQIAANTITTAELGVIGNAYFTNDAGYTDDTEAIAAQLAASNAQSSANAAQTTANDAIDLLANIASDNILSPNEKPEIIKEHSILTGEQFDLDNLATTYSITTQKTTYDNSITALTDYLATLLLPVPWDNLGGDTGINGSTFRQKFIDVYSARQALLNEVNLKAKILADNALSTANLKTTLSEVQSQGYVVPAEVANAINSNTTTIDGAKITTGSITALQIDANTITSDKLSVSELSAISSNIGTITAGTINASVINTGVLNVAQVPAISYDKVYVSSSNQSESTGAGGYDEVYTLATDFTAYLVGTNYIKIEYALYIGSISTSVDLQFGVLFRRSGYSYSLPSSITKFFQVHKAVQSGDILSGFVYLQVPATTLYGIKFYMFNNGGSTVSTTFAAGSSIRVFQSYK